VQSIHANKNMEETLWSKF